MRFRRRRRSPVTWLPNWGGQTAANEDVNFIGGNLAVDFRGVQSTFTFPLLKDAQDETGTTLADYTQGGYLLKRIVGKLFCNMRQFTPAEGTKTPPWCIFSAGIEVLRTDQTNLPAGLAAPVLNYGTLDRDNERDPWIWRRDWILANGQVDLAGYGAAAEAFAWGNTNNQEYGSVMDGPHVDAKVGRRIGPDERLYISLTTLFNQATLLEPAQDGEVAFRFIYRVLGVPIRSTNRRNASR